MPCVVVCRNEYRVSESLQSEGEKRTGGNARSGDEGAVNWKTAGPLSATEIPWGINGVSTSYPFCLYFGPFLFWLENG